MVTGQHQFFSAKGLHVQKNRTWGRSILRNVPAGFQRFHYPSPLLDALQTHVLSLQLCSQLGFLLNRARINGKMEGRKTEGLSASQEACPVPFGWLFSSPRWWLGGSRVGVLSRRCGRNDDVHGWGVPDWPDAASEVLLVGPSKKTSRSTLSYPPPHFACCSLLAIFSFPRAPSSAQRRLQPTITALQLRGSCFLAPSVRILTIVRKFFC